MARAVTPIVDLARELAELGATKCHVMPLPATGCGSWLVSRLVRNVVVSCEVCRAPTRATTSDIRAGVARRSMCTCRRTGSGSCPRIVRSFIRSPSPRTCASEPGPHERAIHLFPELRPLLARRAASCSDGEQQMLGWRAPSRRGPTASCLWGWLRCWCNDCLRRSGGPSTKTARVFWSWNSRSVEPWRSPTERRYSIVAGW